MEQYGHWYANLLLHVGTTGASVARPFFPVLIIEKMATFSCHYP